MIWSIPWFARARSTTNSFSPLNQAIRYNNELRPIGIILPGYQSRLFNFLKIKKWEVRVVVRAEDLTVEQPKMKICTLRKFRFLVKGKDLYMYYCNNLPMIYIYIARNMLSFPVLLHISMQIHLHNLHFKALAYINHCRKLRIDTIICGRVWATNLLGGASESFSCPYKVDRGEDFID